MSEFSIVGGGITGLAVAQLADFKSVNVFEASKNFGGILRDLSSEGHSFFPPANILMEGLRGFIRWDWIKPYMNSITSMPPIQTSLEKTFSVSFSGPVYEGLDLNYGNSELFAGPAWRIIAMFTH